MESKTKAIISFAVLVVVIFGLYFFTNWFSIITGYSLGEEERVKLAQCLDGKGSVLYISDNCPECDKQIELFYNADKFLNIFRCEDLSGVCSQLKAVPAWRINGQFYYGVKDLNELIEISMCDN